MNITINRTNWTGEWVTVRVDEAKRTFTLDGSDYRLVADPEGTSRFQIQSADHKWEKIGGVFRLPDGYYVATSEFADIVRSSKESPYHAVIQLLSNI